MKIAYLMQEGAPDVRARRRTGPANHVKHVMQELRDLGHHVELLARYDNCLWHSVDLDDFTPVSTQRTERGLRRQIERLIRRSQALFHLPYFNWFDSMRFAAACEDLFSGFDLLYERLGWMGYGGAIAAQRLEIPLVLEVNNGNFLNELRYHGVLPKGLQLRISLRLMHYALNKASHHVASGEGHKDKLNEHWDISPDHISVVENGSDLVDLLKREDLRVFNQDLEAASDVEVIFAGAFEPWQGVDVLLRAIQRVIARGTKAKLVLIGSGSQDQTVRAMAEELGIADQVEFTGQLSLKDLASRLRLGHIGVAPYCGWIEFSGLKLFDYKAAGLAVVGSGENGRPVTLDHDLTGWIVPPCDEMALAEAIESLANDAALRKRLGQAARMDAEQHNSWRNTAEELVAIYQGVLSN